VNIRKRREILDKHIEKEEKEKALKRRSDNGG